ncbi:MAG: hypothetical protein C4543_00620 [Ignavibacteriales bacterium]|jgi:hypothetical protein|nr:MAG: hypothetical protein C4543_00620 [Ignavibacteriales bacterium]
MSSILSENSSRISKTELRSQKTEWESIGFVQGNGTTNSPKQYSFTDLLNLNTNLTRMDSDLNKSTMMENSPIQKL